MTLPKEIEIQSEAVVLFAEKHNGLFHASYVLIEGSNHYITHTKIIEKLAEVALYKLISSLALVFDNILDEVLVIENTGELIDTFSLSFLYETYNNWNRAQVASFVSEQTGDEFTIDFGPDLETDEDQ